MKVFILADKMPLLEFHLEVLTGLEKHITGLCREIRPRKRREPSKLAEVLRDRRFVLALMFTLYCNALRRQHQGKYDMASLLLYRLLELISQVRLAVYCIDTFDPDYSVLNQSELFNRFNAIHMKYNKRPLYSLPDNISLFQGYMMLSALGDELVRDVNLDSLRDQVRTRNYNIFAHGFDFIDQRRCIEFRQMVERVFERFLSVWGEKKADLEGRYSFIDIDRLSV